MDPVCSVCSNNAFKIFNGAAGRAVAKCLHCGQEMPFESTKPEGAASVSGEAQQGQAPVPGAKPQS